MRAREQKARTDKLGWLSLPAFLLLFVLFLVPLAFTLSKAFTMEEGRTMFFSLFRDSYTLHVLSFTLYQAFLSTLASLAVGLPGAYLMTKYKFPGKSLVRAVSTVPFVLPSILVVLGFVIFYGNNGILNRILMAVFRLKEPPLHILYSLGAIILAHAFYNFPVIMNLVSTTWSQMDYHPEQAALTLGATRGKVFRTITLPRLLPSILSASTLVFLFCYNSFAIILVLGGGPQYTTMETEIYRRARISLDPSRAAAIALLSLLVTLILLICYVLLQKKLSHQEPFTDKPWYQKKPGKGISRFLIILYCALAVLFVLGPIVSVIVRSFSASSTRAGASSFSLKWYRQLFGWERGTGNMSQAWNALRHSLSIALIVSLATIPTSLSLSTAMRKKGWLSVLLEVVGMLPLAVSSVVIGLGYYLIAHAFHGGGYLLVVLAHLVIVIPFALRSVLPACRNIPENYLAAAHTLGAGPLRTFLTIEVPLLKNTLLTGMMFSFALSLGELNATMTLGDSSITTIPLVMYQLIGSYNFQGACALGTVLILVSLIVFLCDEWMKGKENG